MERLLRRPLVLAGLLALLLGLFPMPVAVQEQAAGATTEELCASSDFGYSVRLCLTAPPPDTPLTSDPEIRATVEVGNPDIRIRAVVFMLDGRNILSDFDPAYAFTLPLKYWPDGTYSLGAKVRLSDDNESTPIATKLTFRTGTEVAPSPDNTFTPTSGRPVEPGEPFVLAAVGDGAGGSPESDAVVGLISSWDPNMFLYLGDVYNAGTIAEYSNWYAPESSYGRFRAITNPTIGNHEYSGSMGPLGYKLYWGSPPNYYSVDTNGWHIVSLDANEKFNETDPSSGQMQWLEQDLTANIAACTVVFFHEPPFSVGSHGNAEYLLDLWAVLVRHNVTLVLTGHEHNYQRWQPLDAEGGVSPSGTVSVVAGTGGQSEYPAKREDDRLAAVPVKQPGALRVELNPNGASLQFLTTDGVVRDSSVIACDDGQQPDAEAPTAPANVSAVRSPDGSVSLTWSPGLDETGIAGYDVYRDGEPIGTALPAAAFVDSTASGEPEYHVVARDSAGNVSPASETIVPTGTEDPSVLFADDFTGGALSRWSEISGLVIERSDDAVTGWNARARGGIKPAYARVDLPHGDAGAEIDLRVTLSFRQLDQGPNPAVLLRLRSSTGDSLLGISISEQNGIGLYNDLLGSGANSSRQVGRGERHEIAIQLAGPGDAVTLTVLLDDQALPELTSTFSLGGLSIGGLQLGDSRADRLYDLQFYGVTVAAGSNPPAGVDQISPSPNRLHAPEIARLRPVGLPGLIPLRDPSGAKLAMPSAAIAASPGVLRS